MCAFLTHFRRKQLSASCTITPTVHYISVNVHVCWHYHVHIQNVLYLPTGVCLESYSHLPLFMESHCFFVVRCRGLTEGLWREVCSIMMANARM